MLLICSVDSQVIKYEQRSPKVNMLTDVPQCRKRRNNNAAAIFARMVPKVVQQAERERGIWEPWCFYASFQSQLTMPLKCVKGNRNRDNNNATVAIFVSITTNPNIQEKPVVWLCLTLTLTNFCLVSSNPLLYVIFNILSYVSHILTEMTRIWVVIKCIKNLVWCKET